MLPTTIQIEGRFLARMIKLDGRSAVVRRVKQVAAEIRYELGDIGRRLTKAELAAVKKAAIAAVVAENAMNAALAGKANYPAAIRASGNARREHDYLLKMVKKPAEDRALSYEELATAYE